MSFDFLAEWKNCRRPRNAWMLDAHLDRAHIDRGAPADPNALNRALTDVRTDFLRHHGVAHQGRPADPPKREAKTLAAQRVDEVFRVEKNPATVLQVFPSYSARLLLRFRLKTPLLTRDDDPFSLFDNPVRKDHILGAPYLAAATLSGLAVDAYQRAFFDPEYLPEWPGRLTFRREDGHAERLFGIVPNAGTGEEMVIDDARQGRLYFAPVWFQQVQYLVINPGDRANAIGTLPIHFEAIAAGQLGALELRYFNPHGTAHSQERLVRADLARLLAALALWWPRLGLGAKRLAGYGQIEPEDIVLQAKGWRGMPEDDTRSSEPVDTGPEAPVYYAEYLDAAGIPIDESVFTQRLQDRLNDKQQDIAKLKAKLEQTDKKDKKERKKLNKRIDRAERALDNIEKEERDKLEKVRQHHAAWQAWQAERGGSAVGSATADVPIDEHRLQGGDSWWAMAEFIAGEQA